MTRHERAYRRLLSIYPTSFREQYEREMVTVFTDQLRDARASANRLQIVRLWLRSLGDVVSTAPGQHLRKEELVPKPLDATAVAIPGEPTRRGLSWTGYGLALLPLWAGIILRLTAPGFMDAVFMDPPSLFGLPFGMVLIFAAGLLMALGVFAMRWARSSVGRTAAFLLLTVPAFMLVVLSPVIVLISVSYAV